MNHLRAGAPIAVGGTVLIPIERVLTKVEIHRYGHWFSGVKEAVAIVVCEPAGLRAIDVRKRELPLEQLIRTIPGLESAIGKYRAR